MGYYLDIKLRPKGNDQTPLEFMYFCGSSPVFRAFHDNGILPNGSWDDANTRKLTVEDMNTVICAQKEEISDCQKRLLNMYKVLSCCNAVTTNEQKENLGVDHATVNETEEYMRELEDTLTQIELIGQIVSQTYDGHTDFCEVLISIS